MSKIVRVTITLPRELLDATDARAEQLDRSRSWVVAEVLRAYVRGAAVREPIRHPYESLRGLGESRLQQLQADLALTPEERVLEAERTAREAELLHGNSPGSGARCFDRYEDYLQWKRREGI